MWLRRIIWMGMAVGMSQWRTTFGFLLPPTPSTLDGSYRPHCRLQSCQKGPISVQTPSKQFSSKSHCLSKNSNDDSATRFVDYNDDAFGLVFLCGSFVAQDAIFATCFLLASAMAATATKQKRILFDNRVPAVVAGVSLVVSSLVSAALQSTSMSTWLSGKNPSALLIELAVCSISILYGFVLDPIWNKREK